MGRRWHEGDADRGHDWQAASPQLRFRPRGRQPGWNCTSQRSAPLPAIPLTGQNRPLWKLAALPVEGGGYPERALPALASAGKRVTSRFIRARLGFALASFVQCSHA
jgi:hypothetical protein